MRTLIYFFLLICSISFFSCNRSPEQLKEAAINKAPTIDSSSNETVNAYAMTAEEFVNTPFMLSVQGDEQWDIEASIDSHDNVVDTIQTLKFRESIVHIKNHDFMDAVLHDREISLVHDIHVGMTRTQFENCFKKLEPHKDHPHVAIRDNIIQMGCCTNEEHHPHWKFEFKEELLTEIRYDLDYVSMTSISN